MEDFQKMIDLRSDTVTRPSPEMRQVMARAEVGDDVFEDDPSVNRLEARAAEILGFEKSLFTPSGTQANLVAMLTHCNRGEEYIVGQSAHTYIHEGGGAAALGGIQPQPMAVGDDGTLDLETVARLIKPDNLHYTRTRLLCLENTQSGRALPVSYMQSAVAKAHSLGLKIHLDGARLFNAVVKFGVEVQELTRGFDSVSICLSKGLGAPVGSLLCGTKDFIGEARRNRKTAGGGMRQAGILAAAGSYVLENNIQRLAEDHANAAMLSSGLEQVKGIEVEKQVNPTNMVFFKFAGHTDPVAFCRNLAEQGILLEPGNPMRLVTHLDVNERDIDRATREIKKFFK